MEELSERRISRLVVMPMEAAARRLRTSACILKTACVKAGMTGRWPYRMLKSLTALSRHVRVDPATRARAAALISHIVSNPLAPLPKVGRDIIEARSRLSRAESKRKEKKKKTALYDEGPEGPEEEVHEDEEVQEEEEEVHEEEEEVQEEEDDDEDLIAAERFAAAGVATRPPDCMMV